jgi:hemolysin III
MSATAEERSLDDTLPQRPLLRGLLHLGACLAAIAATVLMLLLADSARGYVGASVFGASLIVVYGTSAAYHRLPAGTRISDLARRLDHAMIFFLIAGTYTPFCLIVLNNRWGIMLLSVTATVASVGALTRLAWLNSPRWLAVSLYLATGWVALIAMSQILQKLDIAPLVLLVLGGIAYSVGGVAYAAKRPDPWPRVFGFHEVFHSLTILGSTLHFLAVSVFVLRA